MNLMKYITSLLLVLVVATTGLPVFLAEDANRDGMIGLEDVILHVQDFSASAQDSTSFSIGFEKMLNTLSSLADLKTIIDPNRENNKSGHQVNMTISIAKITNTFSISLVPELTGTEQYFENSVLFESRTLPPATPPPRIV